MALAVRMEIRVRRDMRTRGGGVRPSVLFTVPALPRFGGSWQTVSEATGANPYRTSGGLIDSADTSCTVPAREARPSSTNPAPAAHRPAWEWVAPAAGVPVRGGKAACRTKPDDVHDRVLTS